MVDYEAVFDEADEVPEPSPSVLMIGAALRALHIDAEGGDALDRPAIAAGRLLAAAEILARSVVSSPDDRDGLKHLDDLMHGFYGMVVAFSDTMPFTPSTLRGALLEDRLRRAAKQADLASEEADQLGSMLHDAIAEVGRLRQAGGGIL